MALLCCTKKLRDKIPDKSKIVEAKDVPSGEDDWYANLFRLGRYQAIIFTHAASLYSFIVDKVRKKHFTQMIPMFQYELEQRLETDNFSRGLIILVRKGVEDIRITQTRSRSVLGSMNDMVSCGRYIFEAHQDDYEGVFDAMIRGINGMPMKAISYQLPVEKLCQCYELDE